ncbi:unnamed protein product [Mesocestoides corti]|uniref:HECT domain-containing protein n=1 Tax=Mesocestoides corti TaxID=53468 RepID=A0A158QSQ0_MESCO|nr:unnamed protein product [Mesocestoides corti]
MSQDEAKDVPTPSVASGTKSRTSFSRHTRRWPVEETDNDKSQTKELLTSSAPHPGDVYVWGLNDRDQLGGPRDSKIKSPVLNPSLCDLKPAQIVGGSKCLFIVTEAGEVYACGDTSCGKLGLGESALGPTQSESSPLATPRRLVGCLGGHRVVKIAAHSGSRHALALTAEGRVFAWGEGTAGQLGVGTQDNHSSPQPVTGIDAFVVDVAVGSCYSAAVTAGGELFTWGQGKSGRLGHGDTEDRLVPTMVRALEPHQVLQVACGSRDAQTLALTADGNVWAWGDGEFGKLGLGHTDTCLTPTPIRAFVHHPPIVFIACGAQFSVALSCIGTVFTWGKADCYRLGHGDFTHVYIPAVVRALSSHRIVQVAVGALHCLAVDANNKVYSWGDNDHGQLGNGLALINKTPSLVADLPHLASDSVHHASYRVACGSSHSVAYLSSNVALSHTAVRIDATRALSSEGLSPPPQWTFSGFVDAPRGMLGHVYTARVLSQALNSERREDIAVLLAALDKGIRWRPLPFQSPVRDPLGFSYLDLIDVSEENELNCATGAGQGNSSTSVSSTATHQLYHRAPLASPGPSHSSASSSYSDDSPGNTGPRGVRERELRAPCDQPHRAGGHTFTPPRDPVLLGGVPIRVGAGLGVALSPLEQSVGRLVAGTKATTTNASDITRLVFKAAKVSVARNLMNALVFWLCMQSARNEPTAAAPNTSKTTSPPEVEQSQGLQFADWLDSRFLVQWLDLVRLHLPLHSPLPWRHRPGEPVGSAAALLRLHVHWIMRSMQVLPGLQSTLRAYCLLDVDAFANLLTTLPSDGPSSRHLTSSPREFALLASKGTGLVLESTVGTRPHHFSVNPDVFTLMVPNTQIAEMFLLCDTSMGSPRGALQWLMSLARLAYSLGPGELPDGDRQSSRRRDTVLPFLMRVRVWASGALLYALRSSPPRVTSNLRDILLLLGGGRVDADSQPDDTVSREEVAFRLGWFLDCLPAFISDQYEYERFLVEDGHQLNYSVYLARTILIALELGLDRTPHLESWFSTGTSLASKSAGYTMKSLKVAATAPAREALCGWDWLSRLIQCLRLLDNFVQRRPLCEKTLETLEAHFPEGVFPGAQEAKQGENGPKERTYADPQLFGLTEDTQLVSWVRMHPDDWQDCWPSYRDRVLAFGLNDSGQLGGLRGHVVRTPCFVVRLSEIRPVSIVAGLLTLFVVNEDGKVFASGYAYNDRLGVPMNGCAYHLVPVKKLDKTRIVKVSVHPCGQHCLALDADGVVYSWGTQTHGRLGNSGFYHSRVGPRIVALKPSTDSIPRKSFRVVDICAGYASSAAITASGEVYTWGHGLYGALGHGEFKNQRQPRLVEALKGHRVTQIACAGAETPTLAVTPDEDAVWQWGNVGFVKTRQQEQQALHAMTSTPARIPALQNQGIIHVANGGKFCVALSKYGTVYTWGENGEALGHCACTPVYSPRPVGSLANSHIIAISCGLSHCLALDNEGKVFSWGSNTFGQLGDGSTTDRAVPQRVATLSRYRAIHVACGSSHSFVFVKGAYATGLVPPLPSHPPRQQFHAIGQKLATRAGLEPASHAHLQLLRNRFLLLCHFAQQVFGAELLDEDHADKEPTELLSLRLKSSLCFGFWSLVTGFVDDGLSTGRLAALLASDRTQQVLVARDVRLDTLARLLLLARKESLFRRYLQATTNPVLPHGPEIQITRLSLARSQRDDAESVQTKISDPRLTVFAQVSRHMLQADEFGIGSFSSLPADRTAEKECRWRQECLSNMLEGDGDSDVLVPRAPAMSVPPQPFFWLPRRVWKVNFIGESVDDFGGGFSDSITELCEELHAPWSGLPVLTPCTPRPSPSASNSESAEMGGFIVNPDCALLAPNWLVFFGCLVGFGVRTGHSLNLRLVQPMWRLLAGHGSGAGLRLADLIDLEAEVGVEGGPVEAGTSTSAGGAFGLFTIAKMTAEELNQSELPFTCLSANRRHTVNLVGYARELASSLHATVDADSLAAVLAVAGLDGALPWSEIRASARRALDSASAGNLTVNSETKLAYIFALLTYRRSEFEPAISLIRRGIAQVLPACIVTLFTGEELEEMVCGAAEISIDALRNVVTYENLAPDDDLVKWFWRILEEMTPVERSLLLRFVWGRSRLPRFASDLRERQFLIQVQSDCRPADIYLPEGSTCMFTLRLPRYSSLEVFRERLTYAIYGCRSIDSDDFVVVQ